MSTATSSTIAFLNKSAFLNSDDDRLIHLKHKFNQLNGCTQELVKLNQFTASLELYQEETNELVLKEGLLLIGSMEAFSTEKVVEYGKKAKEIAKALIKKLFDLIGKLYADLKDYLKRNSLKLESLQKELKALNPQSKTLKTNVNGLYHLATGNSLKLNAIEPLNNLYTLMNFIQKQYPEELDKLIKKNKDLDSLSSEYKAFMDGVIRQLGKDVYPGNFKLSFDDGQQYPKLKFEKTEQEGVSDSVEATLVGALNNAVDRLIKINNDMVSRMDQKGVYDRIGKDIEQLFSTAESSSDSDALSKFVNASMNPLSNINRYLVETLSRYVAVIRHVVTTVNDTDDADEHTGESERISENLLDFITMGDLPSIRTALRLELNDKRNTSDDLRRFAEYTEKQVPRLFVSYEEKAYAREINEDKTDWVMKYLDIQVTYLKTNFSKKRWSHLIEVRDYLMENDLWE